MTDFGSTRFSTASLSTLTEKSASGDLRRSSRSNPLVVDERGKVAGLDLHNVLFFRDLHRYISRYWMAHLTAAEFSVVDMVLDRTFGWGKLWEYISLNQFVHGVSSHGKVFSNGTGMSKRTVQRAVRRLQASRTIFSKKAKGDLSRFALNLIWEPQASKYFDSKSSIGQAYWSNDVTAQSSDLFAVIQREASVLYGNR
jgi:hypothetical protein